MLQENVFVHKEALVLPWLEVDDDDQINREGILRVLMRAAHDDAFIAHLTHNGEEALRGYDLGSEAQAALLSGDIRWLEAHLGKLSERLCVWPNCRLQQEIW